MNKIVLAVILALASICLFGSSPAKPAASCGSDFEMIAPEHPSAAGERADDVSPEHGVHRPAFGTAARLFYDRMVYIIGNLRDTAYVHSDEKVMNEDDGIYKYDCSGFAGEFILKQILPLHYEDLRTNALRFHSGDEDQHPRAWGFYDYFAEILGDNAENSNSMWYVTKSFKNIQPGDIIVAKYDEDWQNFIIGKCGEASTGHVMIAWSFPVESTVNANEFWIYVVDSANSGHSLDTRKSLHDNVNDKDGIGKGKMWYGYDTKNDPSGNAYNRPVYYRWASSKGCKYTLTDMKCNCGYDSGDNDYCSDDGDYSDLNHAYFERLEGIIIARPVNAETKRSSAWTRDYSKGMPDKKS